MLQGIRVLDLSRVIAGPYCAAMLGDLGADVIKLERPGRGDDLRALRGDGRMSASFAAVNRNKRGIAVDLQKPEGARLAFDLARRADVVIENFLTGVAEKLGLGYAAVRAVNPGGGLRLGDRLRPDRPARAQARLQHDRAGHERAHGAHRHAGRSADARGRLGVRRGGVLHDLRHDQRRARASLPHRGRPARGREPGRGEPRAPARPDRDLLRHRRAAQARGQPQPEPLARRGVPGQGRLRQRGAC